MGNSKKDNKKVKTAQKTLGVSSVLKRLKKAVNNLLEKMAKENEKSFGKSTPDCCQLNWQSSSKK